MFPTIRVTQIKVSRTGTRHYFARGDHALCQYTICEHEALPLSEGTKDCEFCIRELAEIETQRRKAAERVEHAADETA